MQVTRERHRNGDSNGEVGSVSDGDILGKHSLGVCNERAERWIQWCKENDLVITNTWFQEHLRRLWTWQTPDDNIKNQIDCVTISKRFRNAVHQSKTYPGADCGSDHVPIICKLLIKLKRIRAHKPVPKLQVDMLQNNATIREAYSVTVKKQV